MGYPYLDSSEIAVKSMITTLKNGGVESWRRFWENNIQRGGFPRVGRRYTYAFSAPEGLFGRNSSQTNTQIFATYTTPDVT